MYQFLADIVLLAHLAIIVFVFIGGLLILRYPRLTWLHLPTVLWVIFVEFNGWVCPLTPLENYLLSLAGENVYQGDFIGRYLFPIIYPVELTHTMQKILAGVVVVFNVIIYAIIVRQYRCARPFDDRHL